METLLCVPKDIDMGRGMEEFNLICEMRVPRTLLGMNASKEAGRIAKEIGAQRVLILTDEGIRKAGLVDKIAASIKKENILFEVFSQCLSSVPLGDICTCSRLVQDEEFDLIIGIGGGSVMDMTKLVGVLAGNAGDTRVLFNPAQIRASGLPKILLPTTSGTGSEWSNVAVFTHELDKRKIPIRSDCLWVDVAIVDPMLTLNLPPSITAETGMDALSHAIEAYTSWRANTLADMFAEKAITLISENLRMAYAKGSKHVEARYNMAVAAGLAMLALRSSGSYIVHSFSYPLGIQADISHGAACSLMLPPVMQFNLIGNLEKFARIAWLMGEKLDGLSMRERAQKSVETVRRLSMDLGLKQKLGEVGIGEDHIPKIVDYVFRFHSYQIENNPRDLNREDMGEILKTAL
jgi:alcohol dehydrogenase class IV